MSRLKRNILYNLVGQILCLGLGFVAVRFIFRRLGADALGIISFSAAFTLIVSAAAEMGVSTTLQRHIASTERDDSSARDAIRTASALVWGLSLAIALAAYLSAPFFVSHWFVNNSLGQAESVRALRILMVANGLFILPRTTYAAVFGGLQQLDVNNAVDVGVLAIQQAGLALIIAAGSGLQTVAVWLACTYFAALVPYAVLIARRFGVRSLRPGYSSELVASSLSYSGQVGIISITTVLYSQGDRLLVSKLLPFGDFGLYSFVSNMVSRTSFATHAIWTAAFPAFSENYSTNRPAMTEQYRMLQDVVCFGLLPLFAAFPCLAFPLLRAVFNAEIATTLVVPVSILSFGAFLNASWTLAYAAGLAAGRPQIVARLNLYALAATLPLTALLTYRFGILGAACSWTIYNLFAAAFAVPKLCRECVGITASEWYRQVGESVGLAVGAYGVAFAVASALLPAGTARSLAVYIAGSAMFLFGSYYAVRATTRHEAQSWLWRLWGAGEASNG
jgi:O-antigen/teichoic acid export membrane protein